MEKSAKLLTYLLVMACTRVNFKNLKKNVIITFDPLEMSANGNTWEGYQWVDGWPVSPPRPHPQQQQLPREPAPTEEGEMAVETDPVADADHNTVHSVVHTAADNNLSARQSEAASQVNDFDPSHAGSAYSSEEETDDDIPDEKQVELGSGYTQCRAAREAAFVSTVVDISCNENMLITETKKLDRIGTLDKQLDDEIKDCFKGARIEKNGVTVNQFLSCSFDPATLLCITCGREHKILEGEGGPDCFAVTDQNFVGTLPGTDQKKCLHIMRMENASLTELAGIFLEVMEGKTLRPGTCILVGSLSHLSRVGVEAYTAEWRVCVHMLASKWPGISVCPLFPIHASALPGNLFGELLILHTWFKSVYAGTTTGLSSCWDKYTAALLEFSEGAGSLDQAEIKTPLLPVNLDVNSCPHTVRFSTSSTSPAIIFGFDRKTSYELLLSLASSLRRGHSIAINPEAILAREPALNCEGVKDPGENLKIILAGASNLGRLRSVFESQGATVIDLTKPGWMATPANIESLRSELAALADLENCAVVFDVFGNSAFKFKHVDGSLVLPFRVGGGEFHFLGDISLDSDRSVSELIENLKPLFALAKKHFTVIMPPLPRYVFFGCCLDKFHSTNVGEEGYSAQILEATLHFRKLVKTSLVGNEDLGQFWVTDTLACLGTIPPTMPEKLNQLRACLGPDGVHLTEVGRMHLFNNLAKIILDMKSGSIGRPPKTAVAAASSSVTGKTFYWRGFVSDRGSVTRPAVNRGRGRGRGGQLSNGRGDLHASGGRGRARPVPYQRPGLPRGGRGKSHLSN